MQTSPCSNVVFEATPKLLKKSTSELIYKLPWAKGSANTTFKFPFSVTKFHHGRKLLLFFIDIFHNLNS